MRLFRVVLLTICALFISSAGVAHANNNDVSLRLGITDDPDALTFGVGFMSLSRGRGLRLFGNLDFGLGDVGDTDYWTLRGMANLAYAIPLSGRGQYVYPLVGISTYYWKGDNCDNCDDLEIGLNVGAGLEVSGIAFELIFGSDHTPDVTLSVAFRL